jgi:DNA-directed RNA polymerase specialized sigma subunit
MTKTDDVKKELGQYLQDKELLKGKEEDLEELIARATKVTSELNDMPKGSPKVEDKMAEVTAQIVDLKNEKYEQIIKMHKSKKEIEDKIDMLEQPYRNILYFKYIKGKNLTEVANIIHNEYKYTCDLHGQALILYKNLDKNTTNKVESRYINVI